MFFFYTWWRKCTVANKGFVTSPVTFELKHQVDLFRHQHNLRRSRKWISKLHPFMNLKFIVCKLPVIWPILLFMTVHFWAKQNAWIVLCFLNLSDKCAYDFVYIRKCEYSTYDANAEYFFWETHLEEEYHSPRRNWNCTKRLTASKRALPRDRCFCHPSHLSLGF